MKKTLSLLLSLSILLGSTALCFPVGASALTAAAKNGEKVTLIVEFEDDAVLEKADLNTAAAKFALRRIEENRVSPVNAIAKAVKHFQVKYSYTHILNGIAFEATRGDIPKIEAIGGVKKVYDISTTKAVTGSVTAGDTEGATSTDMTGATALHDMGLDGTGTAVAVIDGGLDIDHEAMTLSDPDSARITKDDVARVIEGGLNAEKATADSVYKSAKIPFVYDYYENDTDPTDLNAGSPEHGTHVSGIVAGNCDALTGVAPEAQILMFKVNVADEEPFLANLLAAIDDAAKFDIAAINMSVGIDCESRHDPAYELMDKAITTAHENGITVCAAAGNAGSLFNDTVHPDNAVNGIPNSLEHSFSIASADNTALQYFESNEPYSVTAENGKEYDVWAFNIKVGDVPYGTALDCVPLFIGSPCGSLSGKYALIFDETNTHSIEWQAKKYLAMLSEDTACVLLSESLIELVPYLSDYPILTLSWLDAAALSRKGQQKITVNSYNAYIEPASEGCASYFTSYGVNEDLTLAVDIAAPGGNILSSVPGNRYAVLSGTSMASPHAAGGAALMNQYLSQAYPTLKGKELADLKENILMSTADPMIYEGTAVSPRRVGAGLLDLAGAVQAKAILLGSGSTSALNLGDKLGSTFDISFTVKNISDKPVSYDTLSLAVTTDNLETEKNFNERTGEYETVTYLDGNSTDLPYEIIQSDMPAVLTVEAGESAVVNLTVQPDEETMQQLSETFENGFYVEGYVTLSDSTAAETDLSLPYMGFCGDWLAVPAYYAETDEFDGTVTYYAVRSLRRVTYELKDAKGQTVATAEEEYVIKTDPLIPSFEEEDLPEGDYTVLVTLWTEADTEGTSPQSYTLEHYRIDNACRVTSFKYKTDSGRTTFTITSPDDDLFYVYIVGGTLLNRNYADIVELDGPTGTDENGNYTYTFILYGISPSKFVYTVGDTTLNEVTYGNYSFFYRLLLFFQSLFRFSL